MLLRGNLHTMTILPWFVLTWVQPAAQSTLLADAQAKASAQKSREDHVESYDAG